MDAQKVISDIFSIFHDGGIESWSGNEDKLILKISCLYLAERIHKDFEFFYLELEAIEKLEMECWMPPEQGTLTLTVWKDIFAGDIEISASKAEGDDTVVYIYQHDDKFDYVGGTLCIRAKNAKVFQHDGQEISFERLDEICRGYWDAFGNR